MIYKVALLASVSGCAVVSGKGQIETRYTEVCVDGINYIKFDDAVTVKYTEEEVLEHCLED